MSKIIEAKFVCENCMKEFAGQSYLSINAQINPELKEKVMDGSVFEIVCPHCGHRMIDIHPLVYNDMEKQAMIRVDTVEGLILAEREHQRFVADFPEIGNSYAFYGATTVTDFINKVVFVENGIDPIEGQIIMHFFLDVATSKLNEKIKKSVRDANEINEEQVFARVVKDDDGSLILIYSAEVNGCPVSVCTEFPNDYKEILEHTISIQKTKLVGGMFDQTICRQLVKEQDGDIADITVLDTPFGLTLAIFPCFNEYKYKEGDEVLAYREEDQTRYPGIILALLESCIDYIPMDVNKMDVLYSHLQSAELTCVEDSNYEPDNEALLKKIKESLNSNYFPALAMKGAKVILTCNAQPHSNSFIDKVKVGDTFEANEIKLELNRTLVDGKSYINVYFSQNEVPNDASMRVVYYLDDVIRLTKQPFCDGLIINPESDDHIILSHNDLAEKYHPFNVMLESKLMRELLPILTNEEKEYIGEEELKYINMIYLESKKPKEIAEELDVEEKLVHQALDRGYESMMDVVRFNYPHFKFDEQNAFNVSVYNRYLSLKEVAEDSTKKVSTEENDILWERANELRDNIISDGVKNCGKNGLSIYELYNLICEKARDIGFRDYRKGERIYLKAVKIRDKHFTEDDWKRLIADQEYEHLASLYNDIMIEKLGDGENSTQPVSLVYEYYQQLSMESDNAAADQKWDESNILSEKAVKYRDENFSKEDWLMLIDSANTNVAKIGLTKRMKSLFLDEE